jgi:hypothetical protein
MYPDAELIRLAAHKATLRRRIAARRAVCADAFRNATRPLALLDRSIALWQRVAPLARALALPLGLFLSRTALPRTGFLGRVLRWSPVVFAAWRGFSAALHRAR